MFMVESVIAGRAPAASSYNLEGYRMPCVPRISS